MATIKHLEIAGLDGPKLTAFYSALFDWKFNKRDVSGVDYYDAEGQESPSTAIRHEPGGPPETVVYIEVADLNASFEKAVALGASVRIPPMEHGGIRFALIQDPEQNPIGLLQAPDTED